MYFVPLAVLVMLVELIHQTSEQSIEWTFHLPFLILVKKKEELEDMLVQWPIIVLSMKYVYLWNHLFAIYLNE